MNAEEFRDYCLAKKGVTEGFPFGEGVLVFKVMGKMFALAALDNQPFSVNLKMNIEYVEEYREKYTDIHTGYHMNKKMWNTVYIDNNSIPLKEIKWMIDHSYQEVVNGLTKKLREELNNLT
jgi:predicted DNA-binding protein (MmcQ/YjbR family)